LVLGNVNLDNFADYADGHARGAIQALTARGPAPGTSAGGSMADGEALDWRIGQELNPNGNEPLYMYAGKVGGSPGGPCTTWRGAGPTNRRSPIPTPGQGRLTLVGSTPGGNSQEPALALARRRETTTGSPRGQARSLMSKPRLSQEDKDKL